MPATLPELVSLAQLAFPTGKQHTFSLMVPPPHEPQLHALSIHFGDTESSWPTFKANSVEECLMKAKEALLDHIRRRIYTLRDDAQKLEDAIGGPKEK
jgi:hypothetical protein